MKIVHAAETIKGGIATVMRQLVIYQANATDVDSVICLVPEDQRNELLPVSDANILAFRREGRNLASLLQFSRNFLAVVWKVNPDIVHLHSTFAGFLGRLLLLLLYPFRRPKVVYCPHAFSFLMEGGMLSRRTYAYVERILLWSTDAVVCVSQFEKSEAERWGLPAKKLHVVYNGVPVSARQPRRDAAAGDVKSVLFVGRFDYQKGFDVLLEAMLRLEGDPIHLTAVGGNVVEDGVPPPARSNISYTGWLSAAELLPFFESADLLVIPSRWEGFAMVPLEAMSHGLPVIASRSTSLPEVVDDGVTGLLFDTGNVEQLVACLRDISSESIRLMGAQGRTRLQHLFTSDKMIAGTQALYAEALQPRVPMAL